MFRNLLLLLIFISLDVIAEDDGKITVFVSIPPQKFLVERVGGDLVNVQVMLKPGYSPETYDPAPRQITLLSKAEIYFRIGVPFEDHWMDVIAAQNKEMLVTGCCGAESRNREPHVWTNPDKVRIIAGQIRDTLMARDPENSSVYDAGYQSLVHELDDMDREIRVILSGRKTDYFIVSHDAWKQYAEHYGLKELALESFGREKGPKGLASLVDKAKHEGIRTIFVQLQHPSRTAYTLADEIDAKVVVIDPLEESYIENMLKVSRMIAGAAE